MQPGGAAVWRRQVRRRQCAAPGGGGGRPRQQQQLRRRRQAGVGPGANGGASRGPAGAPRCPQKHRRLANSPPPTPLVSPLNPSHPLTPPPHPHPTPHPPNQKATDPDRVREVRSEATRRIKALGAQRRIKEAIEELAGLSKLGVEPDTQAATALVAACVQGGSMEMAESVFEQLFGEQGRAGLEGGPFRGGSGLLMA